MLKNFFILVCLFVLFSCGNKSNKKGSSGNPSPENQRDRLLKEVKAFYEDEKFEAMLTSSATAFRLDSQNIECRLYYALALLNTTFQDSNVNFKNVSYHLDKVLKIDSINVEALVGKATVAYYLNDVESTDVYLRKAKKANPRFRKIYQFEGAIYEQKYRLWTGGDEERKKFLEIAIQNFQKTVEIDPNFWRGYLTLGKLYFEKNDKTCIQHFNTAVTFQSKNQEVRYWQAYAPQFFNDYPTAKKYYRSMTKEFPKFCESFCQMGSIHWEEKAIDSAVYYYEQTLKVEPEHIEAMHNLGVIYEERKDFTNALTHYSNVLKIDPKYPLTVERVTALKNRKW